MNSATFLGIGSNTTVITGNSITQTAGTQTNTSTAAGNTVADGTKECGRVHLNKIFVKGECKVSFILIYCHIFASNQLNFIIFTNLSILLSTCLSTRSSSIFICCNLPCLSNTTVTAADFATKGRAATEEQLKAVGEQTWQIT